MVSTARQPTKLQLGKKTHLVNKFGTEHDLSHLRTPILYNKPATRKNYC
jgi:hypothetical protein